MRIGVIHDDACGAYADKGVVSSEGMVHRTVCMISLYDLSRETDASILERKSSWSTGMPMVLYLLLSACSYCFDSVLRDDPSKSDMHNREGLSPRMILVALADWRMWPIYCLGLVHMSETPSIYTQPRVI